MAEAKKRGEKAMGGKSSTKSKSSKKSGKHVHEITLRRAKSGELIAKHHHKSPAGEPPMEDEDHVVPEGTLDEHVAQHLPPQQEEPMPQGAAPAPNPAAMMGGM